MTTMTTIALHPTPKLRTVALEQLRTVGVALRRAGVVFLGILGILILITVLRMTGVLQMQHHAAVQVNSRPIHFGDWPEGTLVVLLAGLFVPFGVWRSEDPSRRSYHWTMPIARGPHTVLKLLAGWLWLMAAAVIYIFFRAGLAAVVDHAVSRGGNSTPPHLWQWAIPFAATSLVYLFTSIAVIATDYPWRWIGGVVVAYAIALGVFSTIGLVQIDRALVKATLGSYGLFTALFGTSFEHFVNALMMGGRLAQQRVSDSLLWLKAVLLWAAIGGIGVSLAAYRRGR